jgi:WG containing repeat
MTRESTVAQSCDSIGLWLNPSLVFALIWFTACLRAAEPVNASGYERPYDVDWKTGFSEGLGDVEVEGKWGFIDASGKLVIPATYDQAMPFSAGLAPVRSGALTNNPKAAILGMVGSWCWVDRTGKKVAPGEYRICGSFRDGLAMVVVGGSSALRPGGKAGFATPDGALAIPATYMLAYDFSEGLAAACIDQGQSRLIGYVNSRGTVVIPGRFRSASKFKQGRAVVLEGDTRKIIDHTGAEVAMLPYDRVLEHRISEGMCGVAKDNKWGFVNDKGEPVIPCQFEWVDPFQENLAAAARDGKLGFIDRQGKFVIEPQFDLVLRRDGANQTFHPDPCYFSEGLAAVSLDGKWGYISPDGRWVIKPQFDKAGAFTEGAAKVAVNNRMGYIDRTGNYIWKPTR